MFAAYVTEYAWTEHASDLLEGEDEELRHWWCVVQRHEVAELQSAYEGTTAAALDR